MKNTRKSVDDLTNASFDFETTEISRKSKIEVPSFYKQTSPFKVVNQSYSSPKFTPFTPLPQKMKRDLD